MTRLEIIFKSGRRIEVDVIDEYVTRSEGLGDSLGTFRWGHPPKGRRWLSYVDRSEIVAIVELRPGDLVTIEEAPSDG